MPDTTAPPDPTTRPFREWPAAVRAALDPNTVVNAIVHNAARHRDPDLPYGPTSYPLYYALVEEGRGSTREQLIRGSLGYYNTAGAERGYLRWLDKAEQLRRDFYRAYPDGPPPLPGVPGQNFNPDDLRSDLDYDGDDDEEYDDDD